MSNIEQEQFKNSFKASILLHVICVIIFLINKYFSLNLFQSPEEKIFKFDVVDISSINNIRTETTKKTIEKKAEKSRKIKKTQIKKTPAPVKKIPQKAPTPKKIEPKKKAPIPKKIEPKKKAAPQKQPPKKEPKEEEDHINSILKNLEKESEGNDAKTPTKAISKQNKGGETTKGDEFNEKLKLSVTEQRLIQNTIYKYWRIPSGVIDRNKIKVTLYISFEEDGRVKDVKTTNINCQSDSQSCQIMAESAERAVWSMKKIEKLNPSRYNVWKEFDMLFDPIDM